ncbi:MAG: hypothetical protein KDA28_03690, partial [Phycisphaerales bacterium]|nr:hypothetical protein [Phycisphaerales bacterium]
KNIPTALGRGDSLVGSKDDNLIEKPARTVEINPRVPQMLDELIMRCVEVNPDDRPASMREVADRLELILGKLRAERSMRQSPAAQVVDEEA